MRGSRRNFELCHNMRHIEELGSSDDEHLDGRHSLSGRARKAEEEGRSDDDHHGSRSKSSRHRTSAFSDNDDDHHSIDGGLSRRLPARTRASYLQDARSHTDVDLDAARGEIEDLDNANILLRTEFRELQERFDSMQDRCSSLESHSATSGPGGKHRKKSMKAHDPAVRKRVKSVFQGVKLMHKLDAGHHAHFDDKEVDDFLQKKSGHAAWGDEFKDIVKKAVVSSHHVRHAEIEEMKHELDEARDYIDEVTYSYNECSEIAMTAQGDLSILEHEVDSLYQELDRANNFGEQQFEASQHLTEEVEEMRDQLLQRANMAMGIEDWADEGDTAFAVSSAAPAMAGRKSIAGSTRSELKEAEHERDNEIYEAQIARSQADAAEEEVSRLSAILAAQGKRDVYGGHDEWRAKAKQLAGETEQLRCERDASDEATERVQAEAVVHQNEIERLQQFIAKNKAGAASTATTAAELHALEKEAAVARDDAAARSAEVGCLQQEHREGQQQIRELQATAKGLRSDAEAANAAMREAREQADAQQAEVLRLQDIVAGDRADYSAQTLEVQKLRAETAQMKHRHEEDVSELREALCRHSASLQDHEEREAQESAETQARWQTEWQAEAETAARATKQAKAAAERSGWADAAAKELESLQNQNNRLELEAAEAKTVCQLREEIAQKDSQRTVDEEEIAKLRQRLEAEVKTAAQVKEQVRVELEGMKDAVYRTQNDGGAELSAVHLQLRAEQEMARDLAQAVQKAQEELSQTSATQGALEVQFREQLARAQKESELATRHREEIETAREEAVELTAELYHMHLEMEELVEEHDLVAESQEETAENTTADNDPKAAAARSGPRMTFFCPVIQGEVKARPTARRGRHKIFQTAGFAAFEILKPDVARARIKKLKQEIAKLESQLEHDAGPEIEKKKAEPKKVVDTSGWHNLQSTLNWAKEKALERVDEIVLGTTENEEYRGAAPLSAENLATHNQANDAALKATQPRISSAAEGQAKKDAAQQNTFFGVAGALGGFLGVGAGDTASDLVQVEVSTIDASQHGRTVRERRQKRQAAHGRHADGRSDI